MTSDCDMVQEYYEAPSINLLEIEPEGMTCSSSLESLEGMEENEGIW